MDSTKARHVKFVAEMNEQFRRKKIKAIRDELSLRFQHDEELDNSGRKSIEKNLQDVYARFLELANELQLLMERNLGSSIRVVLTKISMAFNVSKNSLELPIVQFRDAGLLSLVMKLAKNYAKMWSKGAICEDFGTLTEATNLLANVSCGDLQISQQMIELGFSELVFAVFESSEKIAIENIIWALSNIVSDVADRLYEENFEEMLKIVHRQFSYHRNITTFHRSCIRFYLLSYLSRTSLLLSNAHETHFLINAVWILENSADQESIESAVELLCNMVKSQVHYNMFFNHYEMIRLFYIFDLNNGSLNAMLLKFILELTCHSKTDFKEIDSNAINIVVSFTSSTQRELRMLAYNILGNFLARNDPVLNQRLNCPTVLEAILFALDTGLHTECVIEQMKLLNMFLEQAAPSELQQIVLEFKIIEIMTRSSLGNKNEQIYSLSCLNLLKIQQNIVQQPVTKISFALFEQFTTHEMVLYLKKMVDSGYEDASRLGTNLRVKIIGLKQFMDQNRIGAPNY